MGRGTVGNEEMRRVKQEGCKVEPEHLCQAERAALLLAL